MLGLDELVELVFPDLVPYRCDLDPVDLQDLEGDLECFDFRGRNFCSFNDSRLEQLEVDLDLDRRDLFYLDFEVDESVLVKLTLFLGCLDLEYFFEEFTLSLSLDEELAL